jgi:hypothetical protein
VPVAVRYPYEGMAERVVVVQPGCQSRAATHQRVDLQFTDLAGARVRAPSDLHALDLPHVPGALHPVEELRQFLDGDGQRLVMIAMRAPGRYHRAQARLRG